MNYRLSIRQALATYSNPTAPATRTNARPKRARVPKKIAAKMKQPRRK